MITKKSAQTKLGIEATPQIDENTLFILKEELKRMEEFVNSQKEATTQLPTFRFTRAFTEEFEKFSKSKKRPCDKPTEYKYPMSNFVAFTSHVLPHFDRRTNKAFRILLWNIFKGAINTWFENQELSKETAKELGREKYIEHLHAIAPKFEKDFPNIVGMLTLFDASLTSDEHRVKVLKKHMEEQPLLGMHSLCIGAMNASLPKPVTDVY